MGGLSRAQRLQRLLRPEHIVFVGGAALEPSIDYSRKLGFRGRMAVVNPGRDSLCGIPCRRSAAALGGDLDLAFVAVPLAAAVDAVADLAAAGVGAAIVNTAGFSETGSEGAALQSRLLAAAGEMPIMGPNCPGIANFLDGAGCMLDNLGVMRFERGVAVLSNGGAFLADISCSQRSLPLSYLVGMGNQACLSIPEMMGAVLEDSRVSAVLLYLESLPDGAQLARAAIKALRKEVPVVALKCGNTRSGRRAARSHTASLSGDRVVASALLRKLGIVQVETASEALETLKMFCYARPLRGNRIAFATSSGTYAVTGADALEKRGFELPPLSAEAQTRVQPLIAPFLKADNPLDIATGQFIDDARQQQIFGALLADRYDLALQCMSFPAPGTWEDESWYRSARVFARAAAERGIQPVFLAPTHEGLPAAAREMLIEHGSVPLQGYHDGALALAHARDWWTRLRELDPELIGIPSPLPAAPADPAALTELEAKARLGDAGVAVPAGCRWEPRAPVPEGLHYPVVLKLLEPFQWHKSETGAVRVGIGNASELARARARMIERLRASGIGARAFLVEQQVTGVVAELMVGIRRVPRVGLTLTLALGGTLVELLDDSVTLILPVTGDEIREALAALRLYPLLTGWRGAPGADIGALVETVARLCEFARAQALVELEINPLAARAGLPPVALDAVAVVESETGGNSS